MTPDERLAEIEAQGYVSDAQLDWLIARVKKLTEALANIHDECVEHLNHGENCYHCKENFKDASRALDEE